MNDIMSLAQGLMIFSMYVDRKDDSQHIYPSMSMVSVYVAVNGEDSKMLELLYWKYNENLSSWEFELK